MRKHIIDYPRKLDNLVGFDEECCKFQKGSDLVSASVDAGSKSLANFLVEDMSIERQKNREIIVKGQQKIDYEYVDRLVKTQKRARRKLTCEEGPSYGCKPFTSALEILKPDKDLFMKVIKEPNSQSRYSSKTRLTHRIVIMKPTAKLKSTRCFENVSCHCSALHSHQESGDRVANAKTTSFSFKEMKKKLKYAFGGTRDEPNQFSVGCTPQKLLHNRTTLKVGYGCIDRGVETRNSFASTTNSKRKQKLCKKNGACMTDTRRKKIDLSSVELRKKREFDVLLEAKKHLSSRHNYLKVTEIPNCRRSPKTLGRILFSPEHELRPLSPRRDSQCLSDFAKMRFSPYSTSPVASQRSFQIPNGRENTSLSPSRPMKENVSTDDRKISEPELYTNEVPREIKCREVSSTDTIEFQEEDENIRHSAFDSNSENDTLTLRTEDFPSSPSSMYQLDMADNIKYQEQQSPDSVLEPFFTEEANSPRNVSLQTERRPLQQRRLDFEEPQDLPKSGEDCIDQWDCIACYVHLVLEASCLNWDQLSEIRLIPDQEFLCASLFEEVEFPTTDSFFDSKLLFDHVNEVLIQIYKSHFCSLPFVKPTTGYVALEELVLDEIMKDADFYLLPWTDQRTLDQIVSKDVAGSRSWLDVRHDIEQIVTDVAEDFMEETILDTLQEFQS